MDNEYSIMKELKRLKSIRGSGTQLVTVYIPAGSQLSETVARLRNEYSTSSNIKSKTTRTNVLAAIDKIMGYLKLFRETPKNGLAVFAGNISDNPGREDIQLFSIEPPQPLKINIYRCDSTFIVDPLEDMLGTKDTYALVVMDGREATIATLKGSNIRVVKRLTSMAHAKVRKGGQSAARYERQIEESIGDYHVRIGEAVNALFQQAEFKIKGLIVGGPGPAKEGFVKAGTLNYQIKVLGVYDVGYTDEFGLHELVEKAGDLLKEQEASQERKTIERFMQEISHNGLATYGFENTRNAVESKQASKVIINKDMEMYEEKRKGNQDNAVYITFQLVDSKKQLVDLRSDEAIGADPNFNQLKKKLTSANSIEDRVNLYNEAIKLYPDMLEQKDAIEVLVEIAGKGGVEVQFVSSESSYGREFLMGFRGIGALLKYK